MVGGPRVLDQSGREMRILVAGVGNVLNGDDGFGVEVLRALAVHPFPDGVVLTETGIGGIALVQDLMLGYDACIIVDAVDRGRPPGTVMVIEPDVLDVSMMSADKRHDQLADMHLATPSRALMVAQGLGCLPERRVIIGCQPEEIETLAIGLTATVRAAIPFAIAEIDRCIAEWTREWNTGPAIDLMEPAAIPPPTAAPSHAGPSGSADSVRALEARLASLTPATQPDVWAVAAYRLGVALSESPSAVPQEGARRALSLFEQASILLDASRAPVEHARIVNASGAVWRSMGSFERAIDAFRRAAELMDGRARPVETGAALSNLGLALTESGDARAAVEVFDRALTVLQPPPPGAGRGGADDASHSELPRAYAAAALNRAQSLLALRQLAVASGLSDVDGDDLATAVSSIDDALRYLDVKTAPMQVAMLEHTRGLIAMQVHDWPCAAAAFTRSLSVFTRSTFPFQHAIACFNRGRAWHEAGDLGRALIDYEAAAQVFDPRLHREQWLEAASRLADVEKLLSVGSPAAQRHDHIVEVLVGALPAERSNLLRERLTRLLGWAPLPQRGEFANYFAALQRLTQRNGVAGDALLRETIEVLMELPEELLHSALLGLLDAEAPLAADVREAADRRLDRAIQELVMGPQRMRMRDILYAAGWERP